MAFVIKEPPEFTLEVDQWNRETLADGAELAKVPEALLNNEAYLKRQVERLNHVTLVMLTAADWIGSEAPFTQTVEVPEAAAVHEPVLVNALPEDAAPEIQKAYSKAFGIITGGIAMVGDGTATFNVYKKPVTDITIGLKGV